MYHNKLGFMITVLSLLMSNFACNLPNQVFKQRKGQTAVAIENNTGVTSQQSPLGIGLNGVSYWSSEIPFLNYFKSASSWITQCARSESDCKGEWNTKEQNLLDLDENGWVKSLPSAEDSPEYTRVSTLLFRGLQGRYPSGRYLVLYDGEGTITYSFAAQKIPEASTPGRDAIAVDSQKNGILITITATDPNHNGNYIRNIRVIHSDHEQLYLQGEIFNPVFIDKIKQFKALRFMDWMQTNGSQQKEWQERPKPENAIYTAKGVPAEVMIALANKIKVDPWFNIPHQANDQYITNFAKVVKSDLDPNLKIYLEFSNEVWNWQFPQAHYALKEGKAKWGEKGDAYMQWYGMRAAQMCDLWKKTFGNQKGRVVCVMATQTAWKGLEKAALDCPLWVAEGNPPCYQHGIDAYAITGYFGSDLGKPENVSTIESWFKEADGGFGKAIEQLKQGGLLPKSEDSLLDNHNSFNYHSQVAQSRGLRLVAYEGGQHIVAINQVKDNEQLTQFLIELNRHPQMYDVYTQLLNNWQQAGGTLFMHYLDIGSPSKHGSWGALEYVEQDGSPKYNALIDFINKNP